MTTLTRLGRALAIQLADMGMYRATQTGRNQVVDSGLEAEVIDLARGSQG